MRTIALRFANSFAPKEGTIAAHQAIIDCFGFVWYGKLGTCVSSSTIKSILENDSPRILLIHSGASGRYWAYVDRIQTCLPSEDQIPAYYRDRAADFKTWFRVIRFENAPKDILSKCFVASSGTALSQASRHSMSPYFIIDYKDETIT